MSSPKLATITGRKEHAARINEAWQRGVDAVIETGLRIEDAKANLSHGEYEEMVRNDLHFSPQTALKLRAIASNKVLSNPAHVRDLPPSWGTLSELAVIANKGFDLEAGIKSGAIHPKIERKDVKALLPPPQRYDDPEEAEEDDKLPAAEAEESYQETLFEQACLFLESMTDEIRRRFFAHLKEKYPGVEPAAVEVIDPSPVSAPPNDGFGIPEFLRRTPVTA
jgi:hypothetical protein